MSIKPLNIPPPHSYSKPQVFTQTKETFWTLARYQSIMPSSLPDLPNTITDPAVKDFIKKYYAISNDADVHDDYAALFIPEGEFSMNDKKAKGTKRNPPLSIPPPSYLYYSILSPSNPCIVTIIIITTTEQNRYL